jgi:hypothetical protein
MSPLRLTANTREVHMTRGARNTRKQIQTWRRSSVWLAAVCFGTVACSSDVIAPDQDVPPVRDLRPADPALSVANAFLCNVVLYGSGPGVAGDESRQVRIATASRTIEKLVRFSFLRWNPNEGRRLAG